MRLGDLNNAGAKLELAKDTLQKKRAFVDSQWEDDASRHFDGTFLRPLDGHMRRALEAIHHLAEILRRADGECGDR